MSAGARYRHLFTPLRIGPVTVANRIVFSAHLTNYAADGLPTEQHAAYYEARAAGGAGPDHHRGALDPPDGLALREAHPRVQPRGGRRLPADHRRRPRPRRPDLRPDQPQRRPGLEHVHAPAGVGPEPGARPPLPRGAEGGRAARDRARSSTGTPPWPATAWRAASTGSSCSARTRRSCGASCRRPPTRQDRRLRRRRWPTGPASCWRSSTPCARSSGATGPSGSASAVTS